MLLLAVLLGLAPAASTPARAQGTDDPLVPLNNASRAIYRQSKEAILGAAGPVILVQGDSLVLRDGPKRVSARFTPDVYHRLKAVAHVPLALEALFAAAPEGAPLDQAQADALKTYRASVGAARENARKMGLNPAQADRQILLLDECLGLIDRWSAARGLTAAQQAVFFQKVRPLILANVNEAAQAQLDALHKLAAAWRSELGEAKWGRVLVIVQGRQLPRQGNLAVQYFCRLLGEPGEGGRVVYAEGLSEESDALDLLGTRLIDARVGRDVFDDPTRMNRDLLADAARDYLPKLFPAGKRD